MKQLLILGGGPAGLTASIYASRYKIDHLVLSSELGGYLNEIHNVENYPGFLTISGFQLAQNFKKHAESFGGTIKPETVMEVQKIPGGFLVKTEKESYSAENLIYAIGTKHSHLDVKGEREFLGKGVSYCATCDGPFFKNKTVAVIGGGNNAASAVLMLAEHASKVYLIYRSDELKCTPSYCEQMEKNAKVELIKGSNVKEIYGNEKVKGVVLDKVFNGNEKLLTDGVFIEIGSSPTLNVVNSLDLKTDKWGYILTNPDQSTNVEGFYGAGDVTTNSNGFRQIITACSEGAVAVFSVFEKLRRNKK